MAFLIGGANSAADTGYDIENSCRFEDGDSPELYRDIVTATNNKICTLSFWVKRGNIGFGNTTIMSAGHNDDLGGDSPSNPFIQIGFEGDDELRFHGYSDDNTNTFSIQPNRLFRDASAWYHFVFAFDTTDGTAADRIKIYVNGSRETSLKTTTYPDQNLVLAHNQSSDFDFMIGNYAPYDSQHFDGYLADVAFVDGTALTPSSFGEADGDSGIWKPKSPSVTWGNNGFFLEFKESAVGSGSASTIGADTSGNTNHLTSSGIAATDQTTDTPTNNFATFNPLMYYPNIGGGTPTVLTLTEGNTTVTGSSSGTGFSAAVGSIGVSNGKWYYEFYTSTDDSGTKVGGAMDFDFTASGDKDLGDAFYGVRASNGTFYYNDSTNGSLTNATEWKDDGDILSVALNMDDMEISFSTNGASYTAAQSITGNTATSGTLHPAIFLADDEVATVNFGNPNWALSSGVADANGYGSFEFAPPSGYYAICTKNLAEFG
jgi:hypothetical protein